MTVLVRRDCGIKGCQAGTIETEPTGDLLLVFRGNGPGYWENDPIPLRLGEHAAWPVVYACPECRSGLHLGGRPVVQAVHLAQANRRPRRLTVPAE